MATHATTKLTEEEYLALDRAAEFRSEYIDGEMVAMTGGSVNHSCLQANIIRELLNALERKPCDVLTSDMRVQLPESKMYLYPDVSVVCGDARPSGGKLDIIANPTVIFDVLSPWSERNDRGKKFQGYRTIPSLRDYILVSQDQIRIEQFTRGSDSAWTLRDYRSVDTSLILDSIGVSIPLERIYQRVRFEGI